MSKLFASLSAIACFAWVAICSLGLSNQLSNKDDPSVLPSATLSISDPEFNFLSDEIFSFHQSDATPVITANNLLLFEALALHLSENPDRELELIGCYSPHEVNKTKYPNLGVARAKAIEKLIVDNGAPEVQIVTSATAVQNLYLFEGRLLGGVNFVFAAADAEPENENPTDESEPENEEEENEAPVVESVPGDIQYFFYDENDYTLSRANQPILDSLRRALRKDQRKTLILSGFSQSEEEKKTTGNLAELRAKAVRRYLVDNGLRRRQIVVVSHPGSAKNDDERRVELKVERE